MSENTKKILEPLNRFLEAKDRLDQAIVATVESWPHTPKCWIDHLNEPTKLLEDHRLRPMGLLKH